MPRNSDRSLVHRLEREWDHIRDLFNRRPLVAILVLLAAIAAGILMAANQGLLSPTNSESKRSLKSHQQEVEGQIPKRSESSTSASGCGSVAVRDSSGVSVSTSADNCGEGNPQRKEDE